jgi:hypothetical protein
VFHLVTFIAVREILNFEYKYVLNM